MMGGWGWHEMTGWGWLGMTIMMVFWFALLGLLVFGLSRAFWGPGRVPPSGPTPDDRARMILRERFARGEITADEYRAADETLGETRQ